MVLKNAIKGFAGIALLGGALGTVSLTQPFCIGELATEVTEHIRHRGTVGVTRCATLQERVNYLCREIPEDGAPYCDYDCGGDFVFEGELDMLTRWRGLDSLRGETQLCDIDPGELLLPEEFIPYGGYCGPDGPVDQYVP